MSILSLPRELVDRIVLAHLPDKKDILALSLTTPYLLPSAQRGLFSDFCLDPRTSANTMQDFITFLRSAPHISILIHRFSFRKRKPHQMFSSKPSLTITLKQLDGLLVELPRLQILRLYDIEVVRSNAELDTDFHGPYSLNQLVLTNAIHEQAAVILLGWFSQVDELIVCSHSSSWTLWEWWRAQYSLDNFLSEYGLTVSDHTVVSKLQLEGTVADATFYTELLKRTRTPNFLTSFTLDATDFGIRFRSSSPILELLQNAAATLTHLILHINDSRESAEQMENVREDLASEAMRMKLSALTALRTVTFHVFYGGRPTILLTRAFAQCAALIVSLPSSLRQVIFAFHEKESRAARSSNQGHSSWYSPQLNLRALDPILQRFDFLEAVTFGSPSGVSITERRSVSMELVKQAARGLIEFKVISLDE